MCVCVCVRVCVCVCVPATSCGLIHRHACSNAPGSANLQDATPAVCRPDSALGLWTGLCRPPVSHLQMLHRVHRHVLCNILAKIKRLQQL